MVRSSAFPTVEWLTRTNRRPLRSAESEPGGRQEAGSTGRLISNAASFLQSWARENTRIIRNVWIRTPNGEEPVDLAVVRGTRRIGVRTTSRFERDTDPSDALVLVYGRFDTLYRLSPDACPEFAADLAHQILNTTPEWFTGEGRLAAGRAATADALVQSGRLHATGIVRLEGGSIRRIRLSRASDWVGAFERALTIPPVTSFLAGRMNRSGLE